LAGALATGGKPTVLLYRRSQEPRIGIKDPELDEKRKQYDSVGQFFDRLRNPDGSIRHSAHNYENPEQFRTTLEKHLHHYAKRLLDPPAAQGAPGVAGLVEAARETFRGFDQKPADEKALALGALRQRLDALPDADVASASDEVKELLATLAQVVPDPTVPL
jgi:hypothetical protein